MLKKIPLFDSTIFVGDESLQEINSFLSQSNYDKKIILTDTNTKKYCLPVLFEQVPELKKIHVITIPAGEEHKNIETCRHIWQELLKAPATRHSLLINIGGGIVTDIGGFAAATFKRGIDFIHIPTTLMGQVDAAIGEKQEWTWKIIKTRSACLYTLQLYLFTLIS